jgi:hypothetical protein
MKFVSHRALDAAFAYVAERGDLMTICAAAPTSAAAAQYPPERGGLQLGSAPLCTGLRGGHYAIRPGSNSGRRLVVARQADVPIDASGVASHIAIVDTLAGEIMLITALSAPLKVMAGDSIDVDSFSDEIGDPA